jgi:hypothetical protein
VLGARRVTLLVRRLPGLLAECRWLLAAVRVLPALRLPVLGLTLLGLSLLRLAGLGLAGLGLAGLWAAWLLGLLVGGWLLRLAVGLMAGLLRSAGLLTAVLWPRLLRSPHLLALLLWRAGV